MVVGVEVTVGFDEWACLFEFAEAGGVEPDDGCVGVEVGEGLWPLFPAAGQEAGFGVAEECGEADGGGVEEDGEGVEVAPGGRFRV